MEVNAVEPMNKCTAIKTFVTHSLFLKPTAYIVYLLYDGAGCDVELVLVVYL